MISIWIVMVPLSIVMTLLAFVPVIGWIIDLVIWLLMSAVGIAGLVFIILAAMKANEGVEYKYPFILRLIK